MTRVHVQRIFFGLLLLGFLTVVPIIGDIEQRLTERPTKEGQSSAYIATVRQNLQLLEVKGRAPKTGYSRAQFGDGWRRADACDTRNLILKRDLVDTVIDGRCRVLRGTLNDPYTGRVVQFVRGRDTSDDVQIDHVVALSNAWQTGAQQLSSLERENFANDPLELLAVDGSANQQKADGDAASWLPGNKSFRCQYVARQVEVKRKYRLWVALAEKQAIERTLAQC